MTERRPGQKCAECGRTGHCLTIGCCCAWAGHVRNDWCAACEHGVAVATDENDDIYTAFIEDSEALSQMLSLLRGHIADPVIAGVDQSGQPFLAGLWDITISVEGSPQTLFAEELVYPLRVILPDEEVFSAISSEE